MSSNHAPFGYFGGKFRILEDLKKILPPRDLIKCYVEPFFGSGTLFFNSLRLGENEVINDQNSDIYNFFKVLREDRESLIRLLRYTPYSHETFIEARTEIQRTRKSYKKKNLYRAWALYIIYTMSVMKNGIGWSRDSLDKPAARVWKENIKKLDLCADRLQDAIIENAHALDVCKRYDSPGTFIYIDPPYLGSLNKRHERVAYGGNTMTLAEHEELISWVLKCKSRIAISSYHNELYDSSLTTKQGFYLVEIQSYTLSVPARRGRSFHRELTECVWTNHEPSKQLSFA